MNRLVDGSHEMPNLIFSEDYCKNLSAVGVISAFKVFEYFQLLWYIDGDTRPSLRKPHLHESCNRGNPEQPAYLHPAVTQR